MENKVELYDRLVKLAHEVNALYNERVCINVSGIGTPSILLTKEGFETLFPFGVEPEIIEGEDATWARRIVSSDGVVFECYERI